MYLLLVLVRPVPKHGHLQGVHVGILGLDEGGHETPDNTESILQLILDIMDRVYLAVPVFSTSLLYMVFSEE